MLSGLIKIGQVWKDPALLTYEKHLIKSIPLPGILLLGIKQFNYLLSVRPTYACFIYQTLW